MVLCVCEVNYYFVWIFVFVFFNTVFFHDFLDFYIVSLTLPGRLLA